MRRGFKALKQSTKLLFLVLRRPQDALQTYTQLLTYTKSAVTRNYSEKTINGILDYVGGGKGGPVEVDILERFYQATKKALVEAKNDVGLFFLPLLLDHMLIIIKAPQRQDKPETGQAVARPQGVCSVIKSELIACLQQNRASCQSAHSRSA